jgi:pimeloyl-ACP methyl ester carboxylesterase
LTRARVVEKVPGMPRAAVNGIELEYETFGNRAAPPLVLVMGLGAQMILWEEDFCEQLAGAGFFVVRFDNRDIGMSTQLDALGIPNVFEAMQAASAGRPVSAPYTLADMADDTVALMTELGIARAHVVGASMGGMIAQTVAIRHPHRLLSLTSIMSTTGDPSLPPATGDAMRVLLTPPPGDRDGNVARGIEAWKVIGSPGYPLDEERMRAIFGRAFDRGYHPAGVARQFAAIIASGDRTAALRAVKVPTLVIHGAVDPLIRVEAAHATAAAIPGATLLVIDGMGHDLPRGTWPQIVDAICAHAANAAAADRVAALAR